MNKILISACLLGEPVRYDGKSLASEHPAIKQWQQQDRILAFCPEVFGGLPTPRPPAEIIASSANMVGGQAVLAAQASIQTQSGEDVSQEFIKGAQQALTLCQQHHIQFALLSARSPSCGNEKIYSGQFNKTLIDGMGVTAALLKQHGIEVFNQFQIDELVQSLECPHAN